MPAPSRCVDSSRVGYGHGLMLCVRACVCRYIPAMSEKDFIVGTTSLKVTLAALNRLLPHLAPSPFPSPSSSSSFSPFPSRPLPLFLSSSLPLSLSSPLPLSLSLAFWDHFAQVRHVPHLLISHTHFGTSLADCYHTHAHTVRHVPRRLDRAAPLLQPLLPVRRTYARTHTNANTDTHRHLHSLRSHTTRT